MKVYIVLSGERGEGAEVLGVFANKEQACAAALEVHTCFAGGWVRNGNPESLL